LAKGVRSISEGDDIVNKTLALTVAGLALIAGAPNALAQNAAPAEQNSAAISDSDITTYATVAAAVNSIKSDASLSEAEKSAKMAAAVQDSGMAIDKFDAITAASKTDPQVRRKIRDAMPK
jgi:hypothetical protein